jgi:hypothetical protein
VASAVISSGAVAARSSITLPWLLASVEFEVATASPNVDLNKRGEVGTDDDEREEAEIADVTGECVRTDTPELFPLKFDEQLT